MLAKIMLGVVVLTSVPQSSSIMLEGKAAPSYALTESLAQYRRNQGYGIPKTTYYAALNDCKMIGKKVIVIMDGIVSPVMSVIDCQHPRDAKYREYHNLIADIPVQYFEKLNKTARWTNVYITGVK